MYNGNNLLESSMLRSVLTFNEITTKAKRGDMMLKALYALIIEGDNKLTITDVMKTINNRFCIKWTEKDTRYNILKIKDMGLVEVSETGLILACESRKDGRSFTRNIMEETNEFISRVEGKLCKAYNGSIPFTLNIRNIIKKALSAYYRYSGLEFVGLKKSATKEETANVIDGIYNDMQGHRKIAELLVRILAETLHNPIKEDRLILEKWARAYISMQIIGLDPVLANFKENKLRGKSFIFDTDIVLNCITKYALNSKDYGIMLDKLKTLGCKIYVPENVIIEAEQHCKAALGRFTRFGAEQILNLSDELLEQEVGNVLIEDYVKMLRANPEMADYSFDMYLENYYDRDNHNLFYNNLSDIFGEKNIQNRLPELIDAEKKVEHLKASIFIKTEQSRKGEQRTTEVNKELSEADAILYLTICEMNKNCDEGDFFANKAYLLTSMKKGIRSAKELGQYKENIICHPRALLSILMENGIIHTGKVNLINLMDNPFLVYTAKQIWEEVEPLIQAGAKLKYAELNRLRIDVDTKIDKILTCNTAEERYAESKRLAQNGYFFGQDIIEATEKAQSLEAVIEEKNVNIAELDKKIKEQQLQMEEQARQIEKLKYAQKKQFGKEKYEKRMKNRGGNLYKKRRFSK